MLKKRSQNSLDEKNKQANLINQSYVIQNKFRDYESRSYEAGTADKDTKSNNNSNANSCITSNITSFYDSGQGCSLVSGLTTGSVVKKSDGIKNLHLAQYTSIDDLDVMSETKHDTQKPPDKLELDDILAECEQLSQSLIDYEKRHSLNGSAEFEACRYSPNKTLQSENRASKKSSSKVLKSSKNSGTEQSGIFNSSGPYITESGKAINWTSSVHTLLANNDGVNLLRLYLSELDQYNKENTENKSSSLVEKLNAYFAFKGYYQQFDNYTREEQNHLARVIYKKYIKTKIAYSNDSNSSSSALFILLKSRNISKDIFKNHENSILYFLQLECYNSFLKSHIFQNYCLEVDKFNIRQNLVVTAETLPRLDEKSKSQSNQSSTWSQSHTGSQRPKSYSKSKSISRQSNSSYSYESIPENSNLFGSLPTRNISDVSQNFKTKRESRPTYYKTVASPPRQDQHEISETDQMDISLPTDANSNLYFNISEASPYFLPENSKIVVAPPNPSINQSKSHVSFSEFSDVENNTSSSQAGLQSVGRRNKQPNYYYREQIKKMNQSQISTATYKMKSNQLAKLQKTLSDHDNQNSVRFDLSKGSESAPENFNQTFHSGPISKSICRSESETAESVSISAASSKNKSNRAQYIPVQKDQPGRTSEQKENRKQKSSSKPKYKPPPKYQIEMATKQPNLFAELLTEKLCKVISYRAEKLKMKDHNRQNLLKLDQTKKSLSNEIQKSALILNRTNSNLSKQTTGSCLMSSNNSVGPSVSNADRSEFRKKSIGFFGV